MAGDGAVSREILGGAPVLGPGAFSLLALARLVPERSLPELIDTATRVGHPTRRAFLHFADCTPCSTQALVGEAHLCARGARLVTSCRGWRERAGEPAA